MTDIPNVSNAVVLTAGIIMLVIVVFTIGARSWWNGR